MTWTEFLCAAIGFAAVGVLLVGLIAFVASEIADPTVGAQHDDREDHR